MSGKRLSMIAGVALLLAAPAWAQGSGAVSGPGEARAGADLAARWCTSCHLIKPATSGPAVEGPPAFETLARTRSPEQLRTFLTQPHAPMPPLELSRADINDLIAYIQSLR